MLLILHCATTETVKIIWRISKLCYTPLIRGAFITTHMQKQLCSQQGKHRPFLFVNEKLLCSRACASTPTCPRQSGQNSLRVTPKLANPNRPLSRQIVSALPARILLPSCTPSLDVSKLQINPPLVPPTPLHKR